MPSAGGKRRVRAVLIPDVGGESPGAVGEPLDEARLDRAIEREFFPQSRAGREFPRVRARCIDRCAGRQIDPAPFARPIRPERILRREREILRVDLRARAVRRRVQSRSGAAARVQAVPSRLHPRLVTTRSRSTRRRLPTGRRRPRLSRSRIHGRVSREKISRTASCRSRPCASIARRSHRNGPEEPGVIGHRTELDMTLSLDWVVPPANR